ncbi:MAG: chemotaxis protein CheW [Polyangiales bacterium]
MSSTEQGSTIPSGKHLTFTLGAEEYGVEVRRVREIVGMLPVTMVPNMPGHVMGVINLRGKVIPLIDLRRKLGLPAAEPNERTCIVVVVLGPNAVLGLVVDAVSEVLTVRPADLDDTPDLAAHSTGMVGLAKVKNRVLILLDVVAALQDDAMLSTGGRAGAAA